MGRGEHPERPFLILAQQSLFDPTRAPEGKHTVWTYCHTPNGSTVDMTDRIEAQIERFAPGFRNRILAPRHPQCGRDGAVQPELRRGGHQWGHPGPGAAFHSARSPGWTLTRRRPKASTCARLPRRQEVASTACAATSRPNPVPEGRQGCGSTRAAAQAFRVFRRKRGRQQVLHANTRRLPAVSATITVISGPNSASTWRHAPHGVTPFSVTTATASNRRAPSATAWATALRSAQIVSPYDAFSTLQPV